VYSSRKTVTGSAVSDGVLSKRIPKICKLLNDNDNCIEIAPATAFLDFLKGMEVTHGEYQRSGIVKEQRALFLYNEGLLNPDSTLFLARKGQEVLGTLGVIAGDNQQLPCSQLFSAEIAALELCKRKVVELGTLSVKQSLQHDNLVFMLYLKIMVYTIAVEKVDDILIQVRKSAASFYMRNFLFRQAGKIKKHPDYCDLDVVLLRLDVKAIREKIYEQQIYGPMGWLRILCELGLNRHYRAAYAQCRDCQPFRPGPQDVAVYRYLCNL